MKRIDRSALVDRTPRQMFDLVRDVPSYPSFLSWCSGAQVLQDDGELQIATLEVGLAGIRQRFTTRNDLDAPGRITMSLESGPFRSLDGEWRFEPVGEDGCRVRLALTFEVASMLLAGALERGFARVADRLVDDFCRRADRVHGR